MMYLKHRYIYCANYNSRSSRNKVKNSFIDGIYEASTQVKGYKDLLDLKAYIKAEHNLDVENFNDIAVIGLTYLGRK